MSVCPGAPSHPTLREALFAELLFKVAQGQALSLQHPPVWNFFSAEKVCDDQLAGLERVDPRQLLWLFVTEKEDGMQQVQRSKAASAHTHTHARAHTGSQTRSPEGK